MQYVVKDNGTGSINLLDSVLSQCCQNHNFLTSCRGCPLFKETKGNSCIRWAYQNPDSAAEMLNQQIVTPVNDGIDRIFPVLGYPAF